MDFWYEIAIMATIFAVGNIFFGHFEEKTPKWRKLLKFCLFNISAIWVSHFFGKTGFHLFLGIGAIFPFIIVHLWWLPKKGINPWTAEPKDKYYELRGWKL